MDDREGQVVLLVEDNAVDARLLQMLLSKPEAAEFRLQHVGRLDAALERVQLRPYAAILLDLVLPDGEGMEVVERVRAVSPETPIVVLTNLVDETLAAQAMQAGAQDYLLKSDVNSRTLLRALRYAIERQRLLDALKVQTEALQSNEVRLRTLINATPDTVCFKDGQGRWLEANAAMLQLFQLEGVEYRGQTDLVLAELTPAYGALVLAARDADEAAWQLGSIHVSEETVPLPDGAPKVYEVFRVPLFLAEGQRQGLVRLGRDITEHKRTEQSLARERDLLQTLMDNIPDTIYFKDPASRFTRVNQAQAQLLGLANPHEAVGKTDLDFFSGEFAQAALADEQALLARAKPMMGKVEEVRRPDGLRRWVSATKAPIRDQAGQVIGLVGISRDISEIKQRERELEVIAQVSAALRNAASRAEMLPIILDQVLSLLEASGSSLVMTQADPNALRVELGRGVWAGLTGQTMPAASSLSLEVLTKARPYGTNEAEQEPRLSLYMVKGETSAMVCVPLITQEQAVGVLWAGRRAAMGELEVHLLSAIGNIAANAIHRVTLHEQTEQQLRYLAALRTIDAAISGSIDLRLTLRVLLDQVTAQLRVHAADVLLLETRSQTLYYAEGRGFLSAALRDTHLHIGRGHAGRAALERRIVGVPNLAEAPDDLTRTRLLAGEKFEAYYAAPLIAKGQVKGILEVFHRAPLAASSEWLDFLETLASQAAIAIDNATLFEEQQRSNVELHHVNIELALALDGLLEKWSQALDDRNREVKGHTQRLTTLALQVAGALGVSEDELVQLRRGGLLHDVGEMFIPDEILFKPGPLTDEELKQVRYHPLRAYELLAPVAFLRPALDIPYGHHEKWDGSGYPQGLQGEHIPLAARIFSVVDVWCALRSDRVYRRAWSAEMSNDYLRAQAGRHFDPRVTGAFLEIVGTASPETAGGLSGEA